MQSSRTTSSLSHESRILERCVHHHSSIFLPFIFSSTIFHPLPTIPSLASSHLKAYLNHPPPVSNHLTAQPPLISPHHPPPPTTYPQPSPPPSTTTRLSPPPPPSRLPSSRPIPPHHPPQMCLTIRTSPPRHRQNHPPSSSTPSPAIRIVETRHAPHARPVKSTKRTTVTRNYANHDRPVDRTTVKRRVRWRRG